MPAVIGSGVQILNGWSGYNLCLDAENDSGGNPNDSGDKVQLWTCNSGATQQRWNINFDIGSVGSITSAYGNHLCLDAETDASTNPSDEGDKVQLWSCTGSSQQQWAVGVGADGTYEIVNQYTPATEATMVLAAEDDSGGSPSQCGDNVQLQNFYGQSQQIWTIGGSHSGCS